MAPRIDAPLNPVTRRAHFERYLTAADEKKLFAFMKNQASRLARRDHQVFILLRQTGIRVGATIALNVGDAMDAIRTKRLVLRGETQKGGREHSVYLNTKALDALSALLKIRKEQGLSNVPSEPLICGRSERKGAKRLGVRNLQVRMQKWREAAGLDVPASPHWFRHTLAKKIISTSSAEDPRVMAQLVLGHRNLQATAIYTMPDRESIARTMDEAS